MALVPNDSPAPAVKPHYLELLQAYVDDVADPNAAMLDNVQLWWTVSQARQIDYPHLVSLAIQQFQAMLSTGQH